jgi:hypothetical protein
MKYIILLFTLFFTGYVFCSQFEEKTYLEKLEEKFESNAFVRYRIKILKQILKRKNPTSILTDKQLAEKRRVLIARQAQNIQLTHQEQLALVARLSRPKGCK